MRVLFVEDVRELRELVLAALDAIRFRVIVAGGVEAAISLAAHQPFDAIVCGQQRTASSLREGLSRGPPRIVVVTDDVHRRTAESLREDVLGVSRGVS